MAALLLLCVLGNGLVELRELPRGQACLSEAHLQQRAEIIAVFPEVVTIGAARRFPAARETRDEEGQGGRQS